MQGTKFEVIRDDDGIVSGYKLGSYYLMKRYIWMNTYDWIINKTGENYYFENDFWKLVHAGEIELTLSCKQGKQRLVELQKGA